MRLKPPASSSHAHINQCCHYWKSILNYFLMGGIVVQRGDSAACGLGLLTADSRQVWPTSRVVETVHGRGTASARGFLEVHASREALMVFICSSSPSAGCYLIDWQLAKWTGKPQRLNVSQRCLGFGLPFPFDFVRKDTDTERYWTDGRAFYIMQMTKNKNNGKEYTAK